ncbi:MAG: zinc ribbon domain-containing protein [Candidatus Dojkabacteria bacterium]|nr:zinc ribbon domain-containing protein [Candidatus Dojkabacteria bacterium]
MNFEEFILNIVNAIAGANYNLVGTIFILVAIVFWVVVTSWIWVDSDERTTNKWIRLFYVVIGMIPILGWIIYLIVRPPETIDEIYWGDLERRYLKYEAKDLGDCPKCGTQLYPGYIFCPNCRQRIKIKCDKCGVYVDLESKYCTHCGNQMKKRVVKEEEISQEEMQKQIEETKEEAHETVKSKKSKYKQEKNFVHRVGESVGKGYQLLGDRIKGIFEKEEVNEEAEKEEKKSEEKKEKGKKKSNK